ncbi:UbiD family decarboxylase domain-containing protein [Abyssogena phaseoliformis symbiont]|nr:UbiD family decarboxylase domain-containing protein [Abyssogena phaseoliformis symbiont]
MPVKLVKKGQCQAMVIKGDEVDLSKLPIQTCWPKDAVPLLT